LRITGIETA